MLAFYITTLFVIYYVYHWFEVRLSGYPHLYTDEERYKVRQANLRLLHQPIYHCMVSPLVEELLCGFLTGALIVLWWDLGWGAVLWYWLMAALLVQAYLFAQLHPFVPFRKKLTDYVPFNLLHGTIFVVVVEWYDTWWAMLVGYAIAVVHHSLTQVWTYLKIRSEVRGTPDEPRRH